MSYEANGEKAEALGRELRALQDRVNLSNREAGEAAGVSGAFVSLIHAGKRGASLDVIERLVNACGGDLVISVRPGKEIVSAAASVLPPRLARPDQRFLNELLENALQIQDPIERTVLLSLCESARVRDQIRREDG